MEYINYILWNESNFILTLWVWVTLQCCIPNLTGNKAFVAFDLNNLVTIRKLIEIVVNFLLIQPEQKKCLCTSLLTEIYPH